MILTFPHDFFFGTSTSAYQIETAFEHDWQGLKALDGEVFDRTTDHEHRMDEDINIIANLAPNYRFSLMWSKLQRSPYAPLDPVAVETYHELLKKLSSRKVRLMMVLYHWANPLWFAETGGWTSESSVALWTDYAQKVVDEFGHYIGLWNTFNEPNLYATLAYLTAKFPPFKANPIDAVTVLRNMGAAHKFIYRYLKSKHPDAPVGVSHNCASFHAQNLAGIVPARAAQFLYRSYSPQFFQESDYTGISYYARLSFDPLPVTNLYTPEKVARYNKEHDDIWEYYPEGLLENVRYYWSKFGKPIIITENGFCSNDDQMRVKSIKDYMIQLRQALDEGIPVSGYYHWSTWDNFEWTLGMKYRFGLYGCDPVTRDRYPKESASFYAQLAHLKQLDV